MFSEAQIPLTVRDGLLVGSESKIFCDLEESPVCQNTSFAVSGTKYYVDVTMSLSMGL